VNDPLTIIRPDAFGRAGGIVAGLSTRCGGPADSPFGMNLSYAVGDDPRRVDANRRQFYEAMGLGADRLAFMQQVHGSTVTRVAAPGLYASSDALITNVRNLFLCVTVADCVPVFIMDRSAGALAVVHAGWRGTARRIVVAAAEALRSAFGASPSRMEVFVGPAAGICCYEVGEEVATAIDREFVTVKEGRRYVSLKDANRSQLVAAGVPAGSIEVHPGCTIHEATLYHSHRRDGARSGRMVGVAGMI